MVPMRQAMQYFPGENRASRVIGILLGGWGLGQMDWSSLRLD